METVSDQKRELKMWLAIRTDLAMSPGKIAVQSGHAFQWHALMAAQQDPALMLRYIDGFASPKIAVQVGSEAELNRVYDTAIAAGIMAMRITDAGRTELGEPTKTVVAFGPEYRDVLPPFLKRLRIYTGEIE